MCLAVSLGCSGSGTNTNVPSSDEYLGDGGNCNFFFGANFLLKRKETTITLTVPATDESVQAELQPDDTFDFQVNDEAGNPADCAGTFSGKNANNLDFECTHAGGDCTASYHRNDDN
jgi:hypothetical protein